MQYKIFETLQEYNDYTSNGQKLIAGVLYLVNETGSLFFKTNNVDGVIESFDYVDGIPEGYVKPVGDKLITENEYYVDVYNYATVSVDVPEPEGNITITENGTDIDVAAYATATVNVAGGGGGIADPILALPSASQTTGSGQLDKNSILQLATALNIPNGYTSIGYGEFQNYSGLTSLTIPSSVISIGPRAFNGCSGLTSITVDSNNKNYDSRDNCNAIIETSSNTLIQGCNNTVIPNTVTSIGDSAFSGCSGLTSVNIETMDNIGMGAFRGCSGLTSVNIETVGAICDVAFSYCSGLTSVNIGFVNEISVDAFSDCSALTDVTIGNGVMIIYDHAFGGCSALTSVNIESVDTIGGNAFGGCSALTSLTINTDTPPELGDDIFEGEIPEDLVIYVPAESVSAYQSASGWSQYAGRIQAIEE